MANLLPYLFDLQARRAEWPPLARQRFRLAEEALYEAPAREEPTMAELLGALSTLFSWVAEPRPFGEWLEGRQGLPLLSREETERFLERVERGAEPPAAPHWYELTPLEDGNYVLIPNDASEELRIDALVPVATSRQTVQLHRAGFAKSIGSRPEAPGAGAEFEFGWIEQEDCVLQAERDDPDLPWHGVCRTIACDHGCAPLTLFDADSGDYILTGCRCGE